MQIIFGTLSIRELDSFLMPQRSWLLLTGYPDLQHAAAAATNFIVNVKGLEDNAAVAVTGTPKTIGSQPVIVMSGINAAGSLMAHVMASPIFHPLNATKKTKMNSTKRGAKKRPRKTEHPSKKTG